MHRACLTLIALSGMAAAQPAPTQIPFSVGNEWSYEIESGADPLRVLRWVVAEADGASAEIEWTTFQDGLPTGFGTCVMTRSPIDDGVEYASDRCKGPSDTFRLKSEVEQGPVRVGPMTYTLDRVAGEFRETSEIASYVIDERVIARVAGGLGLYAWRREVEWSYPGDPDYGVSSVTTGRLVHAVVDGVEYGLAVVAEEAGTEPPRAHLIVGPNPARGHVSVQFVVSEPGPVTLTLIEARGREVRRWDLGVRAAGDQRSDVDLSAVAAGAYAVRLVTDGEVAVCRVTVVR